MMVRHHRILALLVVAFTPMAGQAPAGYHLDELLQLPDSLREVRAEGRFRAEIVRTARDLREVQLIETAERLTPDRTTILRADSGETRGPLLESLSRGVLSERDGLFAEKLPAGAAKHHGELRYTASVSRADSAGVAYVVRLTLRWRYWCGMVCAMDFEQTRLVLFDAAGKIIQVQGDGKPSVIVS